MASDPGAAQNPEWNDANQPEPLHQRQSQTSHEAAAVDKSGLGCSFLMTRNMKRAGRCVNPRCEILLTSYSS